jgi:hypothetical protein
MEEKTREERVAEDIETLESFVSKVIDSRPDMTKEDAVFEICALIIESSVNQAKVIDNMTKMVKILADKVHNVEMRLALIEEVTLPLLKNMECIGSC